MDLPSLPTCSPEQALGGLASVLGAMLLSWWQGRRSERAKSLAHAKEQLERAIRDGRAHDTLTWGSEVRRLSPPPRQRRGSAAGILPLLAVTLTAFAIGCRTSPPPPRPPIVLGERILVLRPGATLPATVPPATWWYCIDDEALVQDWGLLSAPLTVDEAAAVTNALTQKESP